MQVYKCSELQMNRDMDLIRDLLLSIEADPRFNGTQWMRFEASDVIGRSREEVAYHLSLLWQAGFIRAQWASVMPEVSMLTWQGHEFLDDIKDHSIWTKTKERIQGLPGIALSIVGEIAKAEIKSKLGLP